MAEVWFPEPAAQDLFALDRSSQKSVLKGLFKLETSPELRGAPLGSRSTSNLTGLRKLAVGRNKSIRIVYKVERDGSASVIYVIAGRADDECYKMAVERIDQVNDQQVRMQLSDILELAWSV